MDIEPLLAIFLSLTVMLGLAVGGGYLMGRQTPLEMECSWTFPTMDERLLESKK
jgi:hypothetical protein